MERMALYKRVIGLDVHRHKFRPVRSLKGLIQSVSNNGDWLPSSGKRTLLHFSRGVFGLVTIARTIYRADRVMSWRGNFELAT